MKKLLLFIMLLFIPFMVHAETCEYDKILIDSIELVNKSDSVIEIKDPVIDGMNLKLDVEMKEVDDFIEYKMIVKNDSNDDYVFEEDSFDLNSDYVEYTLVTSDHSFIVKANETKEFQLKMQYIREVPDSLFDLGNFHLDKTISINLSDSVKTINPKTGQSFFLIIIFVLFILVAISLFLVLSRKYKSKVAFIIIGLFLVPVGIKALCKTNFQIESKITIGKTGIYTLNYYNVETAGQIGEPLASDVHIYSTPLQAANAWTNYTYDDSIRPYYFKHVLNNNDEVEKIYLEFTINDDFKSYLKNTYCLDDSSCADSFDILVNGTYSLIGGDPEAYQTNINTIKKLFNYDEHPNNCYDNNDHFGCSINAFAAGVDSNGIDIGDFYYCFIKTSGTFRCLYSD